MGTNLNLINSIKKRWILKSKKITEAFLKIDRKDFILDEDKNWTYIDEPLSIWYNQTISQPSTVAFMLELLAPQKWENILDIWSGSWWTTALLSYIVWVNWKVLWLEIISELVVFWKRNLLKYNYPSWKIEKAWKVLWKPWHKYDKILVSAAANNIPIELIDQLIEWWLLVVPVENSILRIKKINQDKFSINEYPNYSFVPLITNKKSTN